MTASATAMVGDVSLTVRELTVGEVRAWMLEIEQGTAIVDAAGEFVFDDVSVQDLARMCDQPVEFFDAYGPSALEDVRDKARALNPHFFRARAAVSASMNAMINGLLPGSETSK